MNLSPTARNHRRPARTRGTTRALLGTFAVAAASFTLAPTAHAEATCSAPSAVGTLADALRAIATVSPQTLPDIHGKSTAIVILGYGLQDDGSMRPELVERLRAGYLQALLAPMSPIIVTGGNPHNGMTEARAMADWLLRQCLPADRVHIEATANSTVQNAERSAPIMRELGVRDAVVVTSVDHLDRAVDTFHAAGVEVIGTVTPNATAQPGVWQFGPRE